MCVWDFLEDYFPEQLDKLLRRLPRKLGTWNRYRYFRSIVSLQDHGILLFPACAISTCLSVLTLYTATRSSSSSQQNNLFKLQFQLPAIVQAQYHHHYSVVCVTFPPSRTQTKREQLRQMKNIPKAKHWFSFTLIFQQILVARFMFGGKTNFQVESLVKGKKEKGEKWI